MLSPGFVTSLLCLILGKELVVLLLTWSFRLKGVWLLWLTLIRSVLIMLPILEIIMTLPPRERSLFSLEFCNHIFEVGAIFGSLPSGILNGVVFSFYLVLLFVLFNPYCQD